MCGMGVAKTAAVVRVGVKNMCIDAIGTTKQLGHKQGEILVFCCCCRSYYNFLHCVEAQTSIRSSSLLPVQPASSTKVVPSF